MGVIATPIQQCLRSDGNIQKMPDLQLLVPCQRRLATSSCCSWSLLQLFPSSSSLSLSIPRHNNIAFRSNTHYRCFSSSHYYHQNPLPLQHRQELLRQAKPHPHYKYCRFHGVGHHNNTSVRGLASAAATTQAVPANTSLSKHQKRRRSKKRRKVESSRQTSDNHRNLEKKRFQGLHPAAQWKRILGTCDYWWSPTNLRHDDFLTKGLRQHEGWFPVPSLLTFPKLRDKYGVTIAGGQDELEGKIFRLSHFGYCDKFDITTGISCLELTLHDLGYKVEFGKGVGAALRTFAEN